MSATNDEKIETGQDAIDHVVETWQQVGMGMVGLEVHSPWYIVRRKGGDYSLFLALLSDEAVLIHDSGASIEDVPAEYSPPELDGETGDKVSDAMENTGGGAYPIPDEGVFEHSYSIDGERHAMRISLTDDTLEFN